MNKNITVYVNDKPKPLYAGLHVKDAIGARNSRRVRERRLAVRDQDGNVVDIDGALYEGERLYTIEVDPATFARL